MDKSDAETIMHIKKATITGGTVNNGDWAPDGDWLEVPHSPEGYKKDAILLSDRPQNIDAMQNSPAEKCAYTTLQFMEPSQDMQKRLSQLAKKPVIVDVGYFEREEDNQVKLNVGRWLWWAEVISVDQHSITFKVFVAREVESQKTTGGGRETLTANIDFGNQHASTKEAHGRVGNCTDEDYKDMNVNVAEWGNLMSV